VTEIEDKLWLENIQWRQQAHFYQNLHERALAKQHEQAAQIEVLKSQVAELQKRLFGRKCEPRFFSEAWEAKRRLPRSRGQQRGAPGHGRQRRCTLPAEDVILEAPLAQRRCPRCALPFAPAGTQAAHEEIDWEVRVVRKRYQRQCYQRTCACAGVPMRIVAPAPVRLIPKGLLSLGTIVAMLRLKFKYHLPLQRVLGLGKDHGLLLSSGTVCGIWQKLEPLFTPLDLALVEATRQTGEWLMDETRWEVFASVEGKASHRWWVWVVVMMFHPGADAAGQAWADGWIERIGELYRLNAARIELGREVNAPELPAPFVRMDVERMNTPAYAQAQQALVQKVEAMAQSRDAELAQPNLRVPRRKILESLREHWHGLTQFVDQPEMPMDNNGAERVGRPVAMGRKNYYGSGSVWSGQLMAIMMTLFQTLALHKVDDRAYLTAYLEACAQNQGQPPSDLTPWLPWNFKTATGAPAPVPPVPTARAP